MFVHDHRSCHLVSRRSVLTATGVGVALGLAGCLGGSGATEPVALDGGKACDVCGMIIEKHPGPNGQIFYRDDSPEGHDNPARFDSLKQCFFPYFFEHQQRGWSASGLFVTDYSAVEYSVETGSDEPYISSHPEAAAFASAKELHYVVGSRVIGAMGPDFIPFSDKDDADGFVDEFGGEVLAFDAIDEGVVGR